MALFRSSYRIASDVLLDVVAAAGSDRLSVPSLATFLLRGYVDGTIQVEPTEQEVGSGNPRTNKDIELDKDLLNKADARRAAEGVAQSLGHLLEILFRAYASGEITLAASGRAGGRGGDPAAGG
jgi:hypothetical protein